MKFTKILTILLAAIVVFTLTACGGETKPTEQAAQAPATEAPTTAAPTTEEATEAPAPAENQVVTLYSTRHYDTDDALFAKFTEETGIKIVVVKDKGNALIEKLKSEGDDSPADLFYTADAGNLAKAKTAGLLQPIGSDIVKANIPAKLRDKDDNWTGITMRARVIVYSKDRVKPEDLSTYEALTDPKWKGKILVRSSSNQYNISLLASFIDPNVMGEKKAKEWAAGLVANFARDPKGNDRDQGLAVYAGEGDLAIMNTYYLGRMMNDTKNPEMAKAAQNIAVFFPNQETTGTHVNVSGAGLLKSSKNKEAAVKFLEFLTSEKAQQEFSSANFEFPANSSVKTENELLKSWGEFKVQDINLSVLGENAAKASEIMDEVGWK